MKLNRLGKQMNLNMYRTCCDCNSKSPMTPRQKACKVGTLGDKLIYHFTQPGYEPQIIFKEV